MKTEIVMSVRGELPGNLIRTVTAARKVAPVCVVFDGEERGNECPPEIKPNIRGLRIKGDPVGPGRARHEGIITSAADLIVICDGHMAFPDGWLKVIEDYHRKRHKHLTCCRMQSLDQQFRPMPQEVYGGAFIGYKVRESNGEQWPMPVKWNVPALESGLIGCVLGACYAFRRTWYDKIGQPLEILNAWGGDEEILSLATHLMGGKVELLPVTIGHVYAAKHQGRVKRADEKDRIWQNRFAILYALPMPEQERLELRDWAKQPHPRIIEAASAIRRKLAKGPRSWQDLKEAGIVRRVTLREMTGDRRKTIQDDSKRGTPPPAPANDKRQIITRHEDICERCNSRNSFRQIGGRREIGAFGVAYSRCKYCGHKAQIRILSS